MKSNRLKLNSDKTQFLLAWIPEQQLAKIDTKTMTIGEHSIDSSTSAKNLGVTFDSELGMDLRVNNITRSCFYQLRYLRSIRRSLSHGCHEKHWSISSYQVVSTTATIFLRCHKRCREKTAIRPQQGSQADLEQKKVRPYHSCAKDQLHWLPIRQHIDLKIAVFVHNTLNGQGPTYLSCACNPVRRSAPGLICDLLYKATWLCLEPRPVASGLEASVSPDRLFGTHCRRTFKFRNWGWNSFKSMLKTHSFRLAYA